MSSPHANHQGEPGDRGTGWVLVPRVLDERMRKTLHGRVSIRCYLDKREASILNDQAWWEAVLATAPVPAPGDNDAAELSRLAELSESATPGAWYTVDTPWGDGTWLVAGNPDPHAGTMVCDCQDVNETRPEDGPDAADDAAFIAASVNYVRKLIRSGKLVASTGSGEETKGATPMGSGHSRVEPSGLKASPECPSRGWQPIATAPKDGTDVLLYAAAWDWTWGIQMGRFEQGQWFTGEGSVDENDAGFDPDAEVDEDFDPDELKNLGPTHWMPIPEPPASCDRSPKGEDAEGGFVHEGAVAEGQTP